MPVQGMDYSKAGLWYFSSACNPHDKESSIKGPMLPHHNLLNAETDKATDRQPQAPTPIVHAHGVCTYKLMTRVTILSAA